MTTSDIATAILGGMVVIGAASFYAGWILGRFTTALGLIARDLGVYPTGGEMTQAYSRRGEE